MNHREIFSHLLSGSVLRLTSKKSGDEGPWFCFLRMGANGIMEQRYSYEGASFIEIDNMPMIDIYDFTVEEEAQKPVEIENIVFTEASAYTDGKEIRFFHGNAEEVSVDAFHKMKKIESFQLSVSRNNPLI